jgi:hypothetical protein
MGLGEVFWVCMLLWVVFWGWGRTASGQPYWPAYNGWLLFFIIFVLGWRVFGFAIHQ